MKFPIERKKSEDNLKCTHCKRGKVEEYQKRQITGLTKIMFMISHKIRSPIAHILGLSNLSNIITSKEEFKKWIRLIKEATQTLDESTKELTTFIYELQIKVKNKSSKTLLPVLSVI